MAGSVLGASAKTLNWFSVLLMGSTLELGPACCANEELLLESSLVTGVNNSSHLNSKGIGETGLKLGRYRK